MFADFTVASKFSISMHYTAKGSKVYVIYNIVCNVWKVCSAIWGTVYTNLVHM